MANANGTCSHAVAALIRNEDERKIAQSLYWLSSVGSARLKRVLHGQKIGEKDRALLFKLHYLLRAGKANAHASRVVDRWFGTYPSQLMTTKHQSTYNLMSWVDSAAEAYARQ